MSPQERSRLTRDQIVVEHAEKEITFAMRRHPTFEIRVLQGEVIATDRYHAGMIYTWRANLERKLLFLFCYR